VVLPIPLVVHIHQALQWVWSHPSLKMTFHFEVQHSKIVKIF
jgi:hypothetical protein